jgi:hypothetical protein
MIHQVVGFDMFSPQRRREQQNQFTAEAQRALRKQKPYHRKGAKDARKAKTKYCLKKPHSLEA